MLNKDQKLHTVENHNYHIKMYGRCPYCLMGSKAVPKAMIEVAVSDKEDVEYFIESVTGDKIND